MRFSRSNGTVAYKGHAANQNVAAYKMQYTWLAFVIDDVSSDPSGCTKVFFRKIFSMAIKRFSVLCQEGSRKRENRSARPRWLDIGFVLFLRFYGPRSIKTLKENLANIQPPWPRAFVRIKLRHSRPRQTMSHAALLLVLVTNAVSLDLEISNMTSIS